MSSPLAIGAVSAVLRNLLDNGMINVGAPLSPVKVTAVAPDTIKLDEPNAGPSLNLFLHRVSPNQGWWNQRLPSHGADGARVSNPPLALNLHYLLTAYGDADFQAEILLGYGMHLLHERPVLDRAAIRRALDPSPLGPTILPPAFQALVASDLADQVEAITVTMEPIDSEEMSRLWSALQTNYRPSAAYVVSVVLIEAREPTRDPLPVLSRGGPIDAVTKRDRGVVVEPSLQPPYPTIASVVPDKQQPAARLGEKVTLTGHHLDGTAAVARFAHRLLDAPNEIAVGAVTDPTRVELTLPAGAAAEQAWPAGTYEVTLAVVRPTESKARESSVAGMLLAPVPQLPPTTIARDAGTQRVTVTLGVGPRVRPSQEARLTVGGQTAHAEPHPATTGSLTFDLGPIAPGQQPLRLTVDGVESLLVKRDPPPAGLDPAQRVTVPA
jgi:hypothetical protein